MPTLYPSFVSSESQIDPSSKQHSEKLESVLAWLQNEVEQQLSAHRLNQTLLKQIESKL